MKEIDCMRMEEGNDPDFFAAKRHSLPDELATMSERVSEERLDGIVLACIYTIRYSVTDVPKQNHRKDQGA